ncbi:uncharacterized protein EI97DRAFT_402958 [Westerdykella ornata]|uniref:DNA-directed RNA polymerase III subunit n=1 Tax=Westerdykella ornata TaxID=318751 RepID=A0A6A6JBX9_WESOR|nr:uncharacterized protein EI97DRAFT_402958 [Westerdykella ornata]KAF2274120.1 hypothetical protein EI97DRAFT_402958 [Westerdykella ornata]
MAPRGGGRGGSRAGRAGGAFNPSRGLTIGGVEVGWDLTGLKIEKGPVERFPAKPPPQAPPPTEGERATIRHYLAVRERIHDGPFYTILNDGMKSGKKRRHNEAPPSATALFNPFTDNQTYTSKYTKVRRRIPKLDTRPYVTELFPPELQSLLEGPTTNGADGDANQNKKRKTLQVARSATAASKIDSYMAMQGQRLRDLEERGGEDVDEDYDEEDEEGNEKPEAVDEEDSWSAVSSDSEESGDDYNAERYFDNGDDDDIDDGDPYENAYD